MAGCFTAEGCDVPLSHDFICSGGEDWGIPQDDALLSPLFFSFFFPLSCPLKNVWGHVRTLIYHVPLILDVLNEGIIVSNR